jgi:hypothetical protein
VDTICGVHILCATFWRVFDSMHCLSLRLTEVRSAQGGPESALELFSVLAI